MPGVSIANARGLTLQVRRKRRKKKRARKKSKRRV